METRVRVISDRYAGSIGAGDANLFQRTADYSEEFAAAFHLVLDEELGKNEAAKVTKCTSYPPMIQYVPRVPRIGVGI